jgi:UDPglucose 6-dehydrogenase/UDP-N-acetyl-D-galactosamine dehydrogenase
MVQKPVKEKTVCVVGLGYVGTPLAEAFAEHVPTIGFDIDHRKVDALVLARSKIRATTDSAAIKDADFVMICVPTPVTKAKDPDLGPADVLPVQKMPLSEYC